MGPVCRRHPHSQVLGGFRRIYLKVLDDTFLAEHQGEPLRFSHDDRAFVNTGVNLPGPERRARPRPGEHAASLFNRRS